MRAKIILAASLISMSATVHADFMGIHIGGGIWSADFSGEALDSVSISESLGVDDDLSNHFYVAIEHPLPLIPNVRLERTAVSDSGEGTLFANFEFAGEEFFADQDITATMDLTNTDVTLYYELIDTGLEFDLGLTAKFFDGELQIDDTVESISGGIPMLYARGKFPLPFVGFYFGADIHGIGYKDNQISDYSLTFGWETENWILPEFGIEGGYRAWKIEIDEDDFDVAVDAELDGIFINLTAHF